MRKLTVMGVVIGALLSAPTAYAASRPTAGIADARIKHAIYEKDQVYIVTGHYGYGTTITFEPDEKVASMSLGDSRAWQVLPIESRNILFVKPILDNADTNLTVITNKRIYHFELSAHTAQNASADDIMYELKFIYPAGVSSFETALAGESSSAVQSKTSSYVLSAKTSTSSPYAGAKVKIYKEPPNPRATGSNVNYAMKGDNELAPTLIFDDGEFTYIKFAKGADIPALFSVDKNRNESVINHHTRNGFIVIENVEKQITLRLGPLEACVFNRGYVGDKHVFQEELQG